MKAVIHEEDREKVTRKLQELGLRTSYERFFYDGRWYISVNTENLALYFYCKGLMSKEEREFFYG